MLVIRNEQLRVLGELARALFIERLALHVREQRPETVAALSDDALAAQVAQGVERASQYGFLSENDVSRFVLTQFTLGPDFDSDPRHAWVRPLLDPRGGRLPSFRSEQLLDEAQAWLEGQAGSASTAKAGQ